MESTVTESRAERLLNLFDRVGAMVSGACAVHCLLIPFVVTALPFVGLSFLAHSGFEVGMIIFAVTLATLSLCWGARVHGNYKNLLFIVAAVLFFALAHELEESSSHWFLMAVGGACLASGHLLNRKLCKSCHSCCAH